MGPTIFTIFGITGDLATKKIVPSIWHLMKENALPEKFLVIGFGRKDLSIEEFADVIHKAIEKDEKGSVDEEALKRFVSLFVYHQGTFEDAAAYISLATRIKEQELEWGGCANTLYFLSVPSTIYELIFEGLSGAQLHVPCGKSSTEWTRILIEKPFGLDLAGAKELEALVSKHFSFEQIYLIDHYLFKELTPSREDAMSAAGMQDWNATSIEHIDIYLLESIGAEDRGSFYDAVGTLRDVGQNHMLILLANLTMDTKNTATENFRAKRANVLQTLLPWTNELIASRTYRAQYDWYKDIKGVAPDSMTETYFQVHAELRDSRFAGVPIILHAGKRMEKDRKEIVVTTHATAENQNPTPIIFQLTSADEYAKVILAAMHGDQSRFVSPEEVEALWKFTDPIEEGWRNNLVTLETYPQGTTPTFYLE